MVLYYSETQPGSTMRVYNDGRPVVGHRAIVKDVHFDGEVPPKKEEESSSKPNNDEES
jgi:hypothetical protein